MNVLRELESRRYPTKTMDTVDPKRIPQPTVLELALMCEEYTSNDQGTISVFVDVKGDVNDWCLLIYVWAENPDPAKSYQRFVCAPGYRLPEEEEAELLRYCTAEETYINQYVLTEVINEVKRLAPDMNVVYYEDNPLLSVLRIYYCLFRGVHELLFKAGLPYLAAALDQMESCNLLPLFARGKCSPVDLFEKGFTLRLLRLLNNEWGVRELMSEDSRREVLGIYRRFAGRLGGYPQITQSQWEFLKDVYRGRIPWQNHLFRFFAEDKEERLYEEYTIFRAKQKVIQLYRNWSREISRTVDLYRYMEEADCFLQYIMRQKDWDYLMRQQAVRLSYLDYKDEAYLVTHPFTVKDIFEESDRQMNCLKSMYESIARGQRDIGYLRKTAEPDCPLITFEVSDGIVTQLLGKRNQVILPESPEFQWFSRVYLPQKGLTMSELVKKQHEWRRFRNEEDEEEEREDLVGLQENIYRTLLKKKCGKIKKDTILTLEDESRFLILGRTSFMGRSYYPAWQVDEENHLLQNAKKILYKDDDEYDSLLGGAFGEEEMCLDFVEDEDLEKLLWTVFCEQTA